MSDLTERLIALRDRDQDIGRAGLLSHAERGVLTEAANRIAELDERADRTLARAESRHTLVEIAATKQAECDRLQGALREIVGLPDRHDLLSAQNVARAALNPEGEG